MKELETPRTHPSCVTVKQEPVNKVQPKIRNREPESQDLMIPERNLATNVEAQTTKPETVNSENSTAENVN